MARKPSHLGSKRNSPPKGMDSASVASMGSIGGSIGKAGLPESMGHDNPTSNRRTTARAGTATDSSGEVGGLANFARADDESARARPQFCYIMSNELTGA